MADDTEVGDEENWKDLMADMLTRKWAAEEYRAILGEEWRNISRIFDRFILIVFTVLSVGNTCWCLYRNDNISFIKYNVLGRVRLKLRRKTVYFLVSLSPLIW